MYKDDSMASIKSWVLVVILFLTCVVLVTPITLIDNLAPLVKAISDELGENSFLAVMLQTYVAPLLMIAFN